MQQSRMHKGRRSRRAGGTRGTALYFLHTIIFHYLLQKKVPYFHKSKSMDSDAVANIDKQNSELIPDLGEQPHHSLFPSNFSCFTSL